MVSQQQNDLTRRSLLGGAISMGGLAFLAACGSDGGGSTTKTTVSSLSYADWQVPNTVVPDAFMNYTKKSGVKIVAQAVVSFDDYSTRLRTVLSGSNPPNIMRIDDDFVAQYSAQGALADLNPYIKATKFDSANLIQPLYNFAIQPNGQHAAWVVGVQPRVIYYNKTMFKAAGVPLPPTTWTDDGWKWADFLAAAKALTKPDEGIFGCMVLNDLGYEQTWSANNGTDGVYSKDGLKFTLADPAGIEAMQWIADLTNVHYVQPPLGMIRQLNSAQGMFTAQKLGMYFATFGETPFLRKNATAFEWDVAPVPGEKKQVAEGSLIVYQVPTKAKDQAATFDALAYLASEEVGDSIVKAAAFIPVNAKSAAKLAPQDGVAPVHITLFADSAEHHSGKNFTAVTATTSVMYQPLMDQVWTGEKTAQEVLGGIRAKVEDALAKKA